MPGIITHLYISNEEANIQLLEISVLKLVASRKISEVVYLISVEATEGRLTSIETIEAVIELLVDTGDQLFKCLPSNTTQREAVYHAKGRL